MASKINSQSSPMGTSTTQTLMERVGTMIQLPNSLMESRQMDRNGTMITMATPNG
jgi:hypothetical protein